MSPFIFFEQAVIKQGASGGEDDRGAQKSSGKDEKYLVIKSWKENHKNDHHNNTHTGFSLLL